MPEMKEYIFVNFQIKKNISMERSNNTAGRMFRKLMESFYSVWLLILS